MVIINATAPSVFFVLSLGALSGGVVKGITGFGNAIINLLVWVAFTAARVDSGPLQLAVLADSFGCMVCSVPLLLMTAAHKTADWRLVVAILVFTSAGAPLGAVLLTHLPVRWVELAMACVLLLVIFLQVKLHVTLRKWFCDWRAYKAGAHVLAADEAHQVSTAAHPPIVYGMSRPSSPGHSPQSAPATHAPMLPRGCEEPAGPEGHEKSGGSPAADKGGGGGGGQATFVMACCSSMDKSAAALSSLPPYSGQGNAQSGPRGHERDAVNDGDVEAGPAPCPGVAVDIEPLLGPGALASDAASSSVATARESPACANGGTERGASLGSHSTGPVGARLRQWLRRQEWKQVQRILTVGSVAGFASGVMGGMTGIGGPPLMLMYERLSIAKDVVRGTNAVNNVFQVRVVSYIFMGVFRREDLMLYGVTSAAGLAGVIIGNGLAGRLDQRGFSRVLVALMVICCALLFASAAGLKGRAA